MIRRTSALQVTMGLVLGMAGVMMLGSISSARAEDKTKVSIYGAAMLDMGYQTGQNNPDWYDVVRPTQLPSYEDEFGEDGRFFSGVRQSRLGVKTWTPTNLGELSTIFEFELFGTGADAGQTTFRLRHAYGQVGKFGAGQTWSPFMDIDVFPNSLEYWGPSGMVFYRNVQFRWMPIQGDTRMTIAIERPGGSGDLGVYSDELELGGLQARFPAPDLSAEYHLATGFGYVEAAGIARYLKWDDLDGSGEDLSGDTMGWGVNLSSNINFGKKAVTRLQFVFGEGIENYMNDASADLVAREGEGDEPSYVGEALPVAGVVAFLDLNWSEKWTSTVGYSRCEIDNSTGQSSHAFKAGQYALANLLCHPAPGFMIGPEIQWAERENNSDGFTSDDLRIQVSAKYNFSFMAGGN